MTVPSCATLGVVSSTFGKELKRRRELLRLSRKSLETLSGVSESNISNLETRGTTPGRVAERADGCADAITRGVDDLRKIAN